MVVAVAAHEVDARRTGGDAVEHQLDVGLLDVIATGAEAVAGQHVGTGGLAFLTIFEAILH